MYISNAILKYIDLSNQVSGLNLMGKKTLDLQQMKVLIKKRKLPSYSSQIPHFLAI